MASISDYLKNILAARYGKDVRQSIHDAIQQCYYDGKAGSIDLEARQSIEDLDNNKLDKTGDSASNTVTFTSGDSTSPTGWADIVAVASGETHASLLRKFSLAVKNLRYLYKMLGSTDISSISDGTVTGILSFLKSSLDTTNSNLVPVKKQLTNKLWNDDTGNLLSSFYKIGKLCICHIDGYTTQVWNHGTIIATIPDDCKPIAVSTSVCLSTGGNAKFCILANANGDLHSMLTAENDSGKNILTELTWVRCTVVWLTN